MHKLELKTILAFVADSDAFKNAWEEGELHLLFIPHSNCNKNIIGLIDTILRRAPG